MQIDLDYKTCQKKDKQQQIIKKINKQFPPSIENLKNHSRVNLLFRCSHRYSCASMVWSIVLNATFNNISVISWRSVLLVEETGVPGENYRAVAMH